MKSITLNIPDKINVTPFEVSMIVAVKLYDDGRLTSGQAAELAGLTKRTFLEILGKYNISVFGYDISEVEKDLLNVNKV